MQVEQIFSTHSKRLCTYTLNTLVQTDVTSRRLMSSELSMLGPNTSTNPKPPCPMHFPNTRVSFFVIDFYRQCGGLHEVLWAYNKCLERLHTYKIAENCILK
jgi:hypothetical protein